MPSKTVPNMIQGVSNQPPEQRRYTQAEAQWDCINSPLEGAIPRPPMEFVKYFDTSDFRDCFFQEIVAGAEHYLAYIKSGVIGAINLNDGTAATITNTAGADGYLAGATAYNTFVAQPVDDYVFVANRAIGPNWSGAVSSSTVPQAIISVRAGAFMSDYGVFINIPGVGNYYVQFQTTNGDSAFNQVQIRTNGIAAQLAEGLNGGSGVAIVTASYATTFPAGVMNVSVAGSSILVSLVSGGDFTIDIADSSSDQTLRVIKDSVKASTELPSRGFAGFITKVRGTDRSAEDDYYVTFQGGTSSTGVWAERAGEGLNTTIAPATMPHVLVRTGLNAFTWKQQAWSTRLVGDDSSAPPPSFLFRSIRDLFYHQGRLGILTTSGAIWSKTNYPFTFFPDTVQVALATAPIDYKLPASGSATGPATLDQAVQVNEGLFLWAQGDQRRIFTDGVDGFKNSTLSNAPSTAFRYSPNVRPVPVGANGLYFLSEDSGYSALKVVQYQAGKVAGMTALSEHVGGYIPKNARTLAVSEDLGVAVISTTDDPTVLYVYNFRIEGEEYVQSAWNKWRLNAGGSVAWCGFYGPYLYVMQYGGSGSFLTRMNLTSRVVDPIAGSIYRTRLDMLISEVTTGVSFVVAGDGLTTTITIPYEITAGARPYKCHVREDKVGGTAYTRGREFPVVSASGTTVVVTGDLTGYKFYLGYSVEARHRPGRFCVKDGQGVFEDVEGLKVSSYGVQCERTGYSRMELVTKQGEMVTHLYSGHQAWGPTPYTGQPTLLDTKLNIDLGLDPRDVVSLDLINDSIYPSAWMSAKWDYEGMTKGGRHSGL